MDISNALARLHSHQRRALDLLVRGADALDSAAGDQQALSMRPDLAAVLRDYQIFKHEEIFDPAVASGGAERAALGRAMKVECIAAGETYRLHVQQWKPDAIAADPANYRAASRLTLNALRRHVEREGEGITLLLTLLAKDVPQTS